MPQVTITKDANGEYVHILNSMDVDTMYVLGEVIGKSANTGTARLKFQDMHGRDLTDSFEKAWGGPLHVNASMFATLWQYLWSER